MTQGFGHSWRRITVEIAAIAGGLVLLVAGAIWLASILAGVLVSYIPTSIDEKVGRRAWEQSLRTARRCNDAETARYVERLAEPILAERNQQRFDYEFAVIADEVPNAFALPGGFVVVHWGLIQAAGSAEEIAAVLAHEVAHVELRHGFVRIVRSAGGAALLSLIFGGGDLATLADLAGSLTQRAYDRDQERAADAKGMALMRKAGLDPRALGDFFARLREKSGGDPAALGFLSTHPSHQERIERAAAASTAGQPSRQLPSVSGLRCHAPTVDSSGR